MSPPPPHDRRDFEIALICALPLEADLVHAVFDKYWEDEGRDYGKVPGDGNSYTTGVISGHNVVLAHMPDMGKVNAAGVASSLRISYPEIKVAMVVGICGGLPKDNDGNEVVLGDVIISQKLIPYDFGRQYPNAFERKDTLENSHGLLSFELRSMLAKLQTTRDRQRLEMDMRTFLQSLSTSTRKVRYPGIDKDKLYPPLYLHKHHQTPGGPAVDCICSDINQICEDAHSLACDDLGCDQMELVYRGRLSPNFNDSSHESASQICAGEPLVHFGVIGSADTVMKSGEIRDRLAKADKIIGFEMEGAGVWDHFSSIVIKGVCDYADSHKNKRWQNYAAATAACCMKALLKRWTPEDHKETPVDRKIVWHVPFDDLPDIIGREKELNVLQKKLFERRGRHKAAVCGLGGVGKSRIARELAEYARTLENSYSVFWVLASSPAAFEKDFLDIGQKLGVPGIEDEKSDRQNLVKEHLERDSIGHWFIILDNADDELMWCRSADGMTESYTYKYVPRNTKGSLLVTTRSRRVAAAVAGKEVLDLQQLEVEKAVETLQSLLADSNSTGDVQDLRGLADRLSCLPLAMVQAAAYMNMNDVSVRDYLVLLRSNQEDAIIKLLSEDFEDDSRYSDAQNSIASTWLTSFEQIRVHHPKAMELLSFMVCLGEKNIPQFLLPELLSEQDRIPCIGILTGYSFVQKQICDDPQYSLYSMHRLVRLAMRNWLRTEEKLLDRTGAVVQRVVSVLPGPIHLNEHLWSLAFTHVYLLTSMDLDEGIAELSELIDRVAWYLMNDGKFNDALSLLSKLASWQEQRKGDSNEETLASYYALGHVLRLQGRLDEADEYTTKAYENGLSLWGTDDFKTALVTNNLGLLRVEQGRYVEAGQLLTEAVETSKRTLGTQHRDTLVITSNLALSYYNQGLYNQSQQLYVELQEISRKTSGAEDPTLLMGMSNLARVHAQRGQYREAEKRTLELLEIQQQTLGLEHPDTLLTMNSLSLLYSDQGRIKEAERLCLEVLEISRRLFGAEHSCARMSMNNLGALYAGEGRFEEAEQLYLEVIEVHSRTLGVEHPDTSRIMGNLARLYSEVGRHTEAEQLEVRTMEARQKMLGPQHPDTITSIGNLAFTLYNQLRYAEAFEMMEQCTRLAHMILGPDHYETKAYQSCLRSWRATLSAKSTVDEGSGMLHQRKGEVVGPDVPLVKETGQFGVGAIEQVKLDLTQDDEQLNDEAYVSGLTERMKQAMDFSQVVE